jgi:Immunity protein 51
MTDEFAPAKLLEYKEGSSPAFGLMFLDLFPTPTFFEERGIEGNGYTWTGIIKHLVRERSPALEDQIEYDPEADMFVARSDNRTALVQLAALIREARTDLGLLEQIINARIAQRRNA